MSKSKVSMNPAGQITLPTSARQALGIEGEAEFDVEIIDQVIVLRQSKPHAADEDAWAYTPRHKRLLRRALKEGSAGQSRQVSEDELRALARTE